MPDAQPGPADDAEPAPPGGPASRPEPAPAPRLLCDTGALVGLSPGHGGALWKLAEQGRQLDANVVHLPAHQGVETHTEPDLDVLLFVVAGHGTVGTPGRSEPLTDGALFWLPRGSTRSITAGDEGLSYLTVHRRRPGMRIGPARG